VAELQAFLLNLGYELDELMEEHHPVLKSDNFDVTDVERDRLLELRDQIAEVEPMLQIPVALIKVHELPQKDLGL